MEHFTPVASLVGGILIGLSASAMLLWTGRVAGISGIVGGLLGATKSNASWRLAFVAGLIVGGGILKLLTPQLLEVAIVRSWGALLLAGFLVGFGARLGNGFLHAILRDGAVQNKLLDLCDRLEAAERYGEGRLDWI